MSTFDGIRVQAGAANYFSGVGALAHFDAFFPEIPKKVADAWVIAIAIYHFVFEMTFIMLQFALYVSKLCIELIVLLLFCLLQQFICRLPCHTPNSILITFSELAA